MDKIRILFFLGIFLNYCLQNNLNANPIPLKTEQKLKKNSQHGTNKLHWVEVYKGKISTEIMMEFLEPIHFKPKVKEDNFQLKITFPGLEQHQFSSKEVIAKISKLKKYGLINNVYVLRKNSNIPKMILIIEFAKTHYVKSESTVSSSSTQARKNPTKLLIKCYKTEDHNRFCIDIFSQEDLDELNKNQTPLFVKNDFYTSDSTIPDKEIQKKKMFE